MSFSDVVLENIYFEGNSAAIEGYDLQVESNYGLIQLNKVKSENFSQNSIRGILSSFKIEDSEFSSNLNRSEKGAAMYFENCFELTILSCLFENLLSLEGGAIYLIQDKTLEDSIFLKYKVRHILRFPVIRLRMLRSEIAKQILEEEYLSTIFYIWKLQKVLLNQIRQFMKKEKRIFLRKEVR